jgi:hypothetical protein
MTRHAADIVAFVAHLTALIGIFASALWPMRRDFGAAIYALFLLIWTDLVCTGLTLSCFGQLGNRAAYVAVSLGLAIAFRMAARPFISLPPVGEGADETRDSRAAHAFIWLAILTAPITSLI